MSKNYYELLEVTRKADAAEIKSSYRKLAIKYHPDKNRDNPQAAEKFMEITKAYSIISDPEKRKQYDNQLDNKGQSKFTNVSRQQKGFKKGFDLSEALHVFMYNMGSEAFTQQDQRGNPNKGTDLKLTVPLSLKEILSGCNKTIKVKRLVPCTSCSGMGSSSGVIQEDVCPQCGGKGKVRVVGQAEAVLCNMCKGRGAVLKNPCTSCGGEGHSQGVSEVVIEFPPGISEGNYITVNSMGDAGTLGGEAGDLVVFIEEKPNSGFERMGFDLKTTTTIPVTTAILGGKTSVADLSGNVHTFKINEGCQSGDLYKITKCGLPQYRMEGRGDLLIEVHVEIPHLQSGEPLELFKKFAESYENFNKSRSIREMGDFHIVDFHPDDSDSEINASLAAAELIAETGNSMALKVSGLAFFNSMALASLIRMSKKITSSGGRFCLLDATYDMKELIEDCSLDSIIEIVNNEVDLISGTVDGDLKDNGKYTVKKVGNRYLVYAGDGDVEYNLLEKNGVINYLGESGASVGIDLSDINMVASKTLGAWIRYYKEAHKNGAEFFLFAPNSAVMSVLESTNLDSLIHIYNNIEELP